MKHQYYVWATLAWLTASVAFADEEFSLVINPFTGAAEIRNDLSTPVELDAYFIKSPADRVLQIDAWSSFEDNAVEGWRETSSETGNRLGELNLTGSLTVPGNGSFAIGNPYSPFSPTQLGEQEPGLATLDFTYTLADESSQKTGDVEFAARNTLVLVVDPETGSASLENQSSFDINLDGYLIKSIPETLSVDTWQPLSTADAAWRSATGTTNRIAEGNLLGSTMIPSNGSLSLGQAIDPAILNDELDLELDFTTTDFPSQISGGVLFRTLGAGDPLDCNSDGSVNITDANCTPPSQLDGFLAGLSPASLRGDTDGNGGVDFADFLTLSGNFGNAGQYTDGDFDKNGMVDFADFLTLSGAFGQSGAAGVSAVPEPAGFGVLLPSVLVVSCYLRRRRS